MRLLQQILFIFFAALLLEFFLPWWSIAIAGFCGGIFLHSGKNFLSGFIAISALWLGYILWINSESLAPLADRVAAVFNVNKTILISLTTLIGGLGGGLAALTGSYLRQPKKKNLYY
ncbi:MAG: hypothetical protein ACK514_08965 [Bacteroidota bacterium]|jgi:hypothetical protein